MKGGVRILDVLYSSQAISEILRLPVRYTVRCGWSAVGSWGAGDGGGSGQENAENKMMVMLMESKPKGASILTLFKRLKLRTLCIS